MYKFELPGNHLGGFHWYHPHIEAVSELTVGSGTFDPLVVATSEDGSEISALVGALEQHIFTISKIYPVKLVDLSAGYVGQFDAVDGVYPRQNISDSTFKVEYNEDLEEYLQLEEENTNYTLINGFLRPKITMVANEWYRFSFLFAGGTDEEEDLSDVKFKIGKNTELSAEGDFDDLNITPHIDASYSSEINITIRSESLNFHFLTSVDECVNTLNLTVTPFSVNGDYFRGYYCDDKALNITVLKVQNMYQFNLNHGHHPLHIHVNHYQLQNAADDGSGYHEPGDFVDTVTSACDASGCVNAATRRPETEGTFFRLYTDRYTGRMIAYCHNMDHSDSLALGEMWVLPDEESTLFDVEPQWEDTCSDLLDLII
eukprot:augustus_masked-scaffold_27-processed-gene-0.2-mRNA-1 protein AED:1.00 eAED:1.00 QI:0/0/0/0/1/1/2/0/371